MMKLKLLGLTCSSILLAIAGCGGAVEDSNAAAASGSKSKGLGGATVQGGATAQGGATTDGGATAQGGEGGSNGHSCWYDGVLWPAGVTFPANDGCNSCSCIIGLPVCTFLDCPNGCEYQGVHVVLGETVPAGDGCNSCTCSSTGSSAISCTSATCIGSCSYAGRMYGNGDGFPSTDGCNQCGCENGNVWCQTMFCGECAPSTEYWRKYVGVTSSECATIRLACPTGSAAFSNACGCGCEQSPDCPKDFLCMRTDAPPTIDGGAGGASGAYPKPYIPVPVGGSSGTGISDGAPTDTPCATPAQQAQCPLTPVDTIIL
jgi:hypothetical protein